MPIESASDRAVFFDADEFGTTATINGTSVEGIFMDGSEEIVAPFGQIEVISNKPVFIARTADIDASGVDTGSKNAATINSTSYTVTEMKPDGAGVTVLELHEA